MGAVLEEFSSPHPHYSKFIRPKFLSKSFKIDFLLKDFWAKSFVRREAFRNLRVEREVSMSGADLTDF